MRLANAQRLAALTKNQAGSVIVNVGGPIEPTRTTLLDGKQRQRV